MRLIGRLQDEAQARHLSNVLYGRNIESRIDPSPDGRWEIWVLDETDVERAGALFDEFRQHPDDPAFDQIVHAAQEKMKQDRKSQAAKRARIVDARTALYKPLAPMGVVSVILAIISVGVTLLTDFGKNQRFTQPLSITEYGAVERSDGEYSAWDTGLPEIRHGQVWRLFTPMFLHFGILHLLFNMLWLRDLGSMIEARKSPWMLLILTFVLAAVSNVAQYLYSGPNFGGMSGVVYGLFGYIWMQGRFNPAFRLALHPQIVTMMIAWFFLCLTGFVGPVANVAHGVGAGVGIGWGFLAAQFSLKMRRPW
jgi:GlpG protein